MRNLSLRVPDRTRELADMYAGLVDHAESADIMRQAMSIGMSVLAALIPPGQNGLYGNISPERMAIEMRPYGVLIADFLARHGQDATPVMSQESSNAVLQVSPVDEAKQAIVDIDPDMQDMMGAFG